jgi:hypothetical protein
LTSFSGHAIINHRKGVEHMTSKQIREKVAFYREALSEGRITVQELDAFIAALAHIANVERCIAEMKAILG